MGIQRAPYLKYLNHKSDIDKFLQRKIKQQDKRIDELEEGLKPFARFACDFNNRCECYNCIAKKLLATQDS